MIKLYHGTARRNLPAIKREGLRPRGAPGADTAWPYCRAMHASADRDASVFVTPHVDVAAMFADIAGGRPGAGAVIEIELPDDERRNIVPDEAGAPPGDPDATEYLCHRGPIPPEALKRVALV